MATNATGLSAIVIKQIETAVQLSALDDAALLDHFNHDMARITTFLLGFNLAFNATRIADLADSIESRLIALWSAA